VNYEVLPGFGFAGVGYELGHVRELLQRLGGPHLGPRTVHVAGTKGKGSVAAMVAASLSACGYVTALYTSPHLVHLGERISVDGLSASPGDLSAAIERIQPHLEAMTREGRWRQFTYFELLTVLAFDYFRAKHVDAQVIEVGLGGRLDATNVVCPDVCVITPISLEHTAVLGDTVGKIAAEKAGIIKPGATVVCAPQQSDALRVVEAVCVDRSVTLVRVGIDVPFDAVQSSLAGQVVRIGGPTISRIVRTALTGTFQSQNAAVAATALDVLLSRGVPLDEACVARGLLAVRWPGRFQLLADDPVLLLDGAHNPESMRRLGESLALLPSLDDIVFVLGFSSDKDVRASVSALSHLGGRLVLTQAAQPRALEPRELAMRIAPLGLNVTCEQDPMRALWRARSMVGDSGVVCVAGSLYLVGELLSRWQKDTTGTERWKSSHSR
jgi:dihydrofolate synthase/folylpolyglutamate synthase